MLTKSRRLMCVGVALLLVSAIICHADTWRQVYWQDDFEDGDSTNDPSWISFGTSGASATTVTWEGDYAFRHTAPYNTEAGIGLSAALVGDRRIGQGIEGWVDTSPLNSDDWASLFLLRYSPPSLGVGTGYALTVTNTATAGIVAQLYQLDDTDFFPITDPVLVTSTYEDLWVRFQARGTDGDTQLLARVWADGTPEPTEWHLNSDLPGSTGGISSFYNSGYGALGVAATASGVTADAYFDDVVYGTPEPGTLALILTGIGAVVARTRRRA